MKRQFVISKLMVISGFTLVLMICQQSPAQSPNTAAPEKVTKVFYGQIGKYDMAFSLTRTDEKLNGSYSYETKPALYGIFASSLELDGTISGDGSFTLKEKDTEGNQTGNLKGMWSTETIAGESRAKLTGMWSKPDGSKALAFSLFEERHDLGAGVKVVSKEFNEDNQEFKYEFSASYPQLTGATDAGIVKINWNLARKGMLIHFQVAHAIGDVVDAFIPYTQLQAEIDWSGPMASVVK